MQKLAKFFFKKRNRRRRQSDIVRMAVLDRFWTIFQYTVVIPQNN